MAVDKLFWNTFASPRWISARTIAQVARVEKYPLRFGVMTDTSPCRALSIRYAIEASSIPVEQPNERIAGLELEISGLVGQASKRASRHAALRAERLEGRSMAT